MAKLTETEKITINLGPVDLGQIDLLVQEGFYSNRTDFIRTAIRNQLATHSEVVRETVARKTMVLGLQNFTRRELEAVRDAGEKLQINVLGLATIDDDVSPELAREAIESIVVLGAFRTSPDCKEEHWRTASVDGNRLSGQTSKQRPYRKGVQYDEHQLPAARKEPGGTGMQEGNGRGNPAHQRWPSHGGHGPHPAHARVIQAGHRKRLDRANIGKTYPASSGNVELPGVSWMTSR